MPAPALSQAALKSLLVYDPETGRFTWLERSGQKAWNTRYAGKEAGFLWACGRNTYRSIRIFDWPFLGHRLAVLYMTGGWPYAVVDHINMVGADNRWSNLRLATMVENGRNSGPKSNNKIGLKGVSQARDGKRFRATIFAGGKQHHIGTFATADEAHRAYAAAAADLHGSFARAV